MAELVVGTIAFLSDLDSSKAETFCYYVGTAREIPSISRKAQTPIRRHLLPGYQAIPFPPIALLKDVRRKPVGRERLSPHLWELASIDQTASPELGRGSRQGSKPTASRSGEAMFSFVGTGVDRSDRQSRTGKRQPTRLQVDLQLRLRSSWTPRAKGSAI